MRYDPGAEKRAYDALKDAEKSLGLAQQSAAHAESLLTEKGKRLAELLKLRGAAEQNRAERERMLKAIDSLGILASVLESAQAQLRSEFTDTVNAALTDSWLKIYPYRDYSDLKLDVDESGDYTLKLKRRDGEWVGVEGITSGGERSCACLALRIALSLVLTQNLSWLVLDEPTHNIDRQGIRELARTLREHLPKIVEQIFIITHEEELESAASGYLYRFERKKEDDEPTRAILESSAL
jgi:DNA repair exonuclease SbcCD ATPase subunit